VAIQFRRRIARAFVSARGYRDWLAGVVNANMGGTELKTEIPT
jgi:hypothetical protein